MNGLVAQQTKKGLKWMPRYAYRCVGCMYQFDAFHGFSEKARCPACNSSVCERIPSVGFSLSGFAKEQKTKTGEEVKKFIEESKEDLKQQKRALKDKQ